MYNVIIIHTPSDERTDALRRSVSHEAQRFGTEVSYLDWALLSEAPDTPSVVVYLGSIAARADPACMERVDSALSLGLPVIAVVDDGALREEQVPEALSGLLAVTWTVGTDVPEGLLTATLEVLGIIEKERRVFISYRQSDAAAVATELHHALTETRFTVFVDRFQTSPPEDVQSRIERELEDKAFVLLLHSPDMHTSKWVRAEITQALESQLPVLVVKWTSTVINIPEIKDLPTVLVEPLGGAEPTRVEQAKLKEIVELVEEHHADGLNRRRRQSIVAARVFAEAKGWEVIEDPPWKLILKRHPVWTLLGVTPRLVQAEDLYELGTYDPSIELPKDVTGWRRVLLQNSTKLHGRYDFLKWVVGERDLELGLGIESLNALL